MIETAEKEGKIRPGLFGMAKEEAKERRKGWKCTKKSTLPKEK
jgi:hypothetical protein